ncbi:MAG: lipoate--protein ligase family protein [Fretibacterium sp.]|nr:lipoate--protein ligase family protein [Fretibacterium sp.]
MVCLESPGTDPHYNLALEEYLCGLTGRGAAGPGGGFFMLWRNVPSVIIGRFQNADSEVSAVFAAARRIPVVRRSSGGGAVYHDLGNVNYSFILPDCRGTEAAFPSERIGSFSFFAGKIIRALARLGVAAEFSPGSNDITVEGYKISGMAQLRHDGVLLCHGTLLFDCSLDALSQVLNVPDEKLIRHGVKSARGRVANLKPLLPGVADTEMFMALLWKAFHEDDSFFMDGEPFSLSAQDEEEVRALMERKYRSQDWNIRGESGGRAI